MLHTKFDIDLPSSSGEELLTDDGQCVTHNDERQPIAIVIQETLVTLKSQHKSYY